MNDLYFQFPDVEIARESLIAAGLLAVDPESGQPYATASHSVHVVGTLYREPDGDALPGFHVNVRSPEECPADLAPFRVYPATPAHVWA